MSRYARFRAHLTAGGIDLVGAVAAAGAVPLWRDATAAPTSGTLLLCATGGRAHWDQLSEVARRPAHAIDDASRATIARGLGLLDASARLLDPAETLGLDLRRLAVAAGLGHLSPYLQMVIHPRFGPWISLRGVVHTDLELAPVEPVAFDPCTDCARPCLTACPVGAFAADRAWDFPRCADHRLRGRDAPRHCDDACHARRACVVGRAHAYSDSEYRHRHQANLPDVRRWRARSD